jgi:hypothetical protein
MAHKSNEQLIRAKRINALVKEFEQNVTYLEIGVETRKTLFVVNANTRVGVNPSPAFPTKSLPSDVEFHAKTSNAFLGSSSPQENST